MVLHGSDADSLGSLCVFVCLDVTTCRLRQAYGSQNERKEPFQSLRFGVSAVSAESPFMSLGSDSKSPQERQLSNFEDVSGSAFQCGGRLGGI